MSEMISFSVPSEWVKQLKDLYPEESLNKAAKRLLSQSLKSLEGSLEGSLDAAKAEIEQLKAEIAEIKRDYVTLDEHKWAFNELCEPIAVNSQFRKKWERLTDEIQLDEHQIQEQIDKGFTISDEQLVIHLKLPLETIVNWRTGKLKKKPTKLTHWTYEGTGWAFYPPTVETITRKGFSPKV